MKLLTRLVAFLAGFFIVSNLQAQYISNKGKDFWVGYGFHHFMTGCESLNQQNMTLYLSVEDLPAGKAYATVTVTIDSSGITPALWWKRTYQIPANTVISMENSATPAVASLSYPNTGTNLWGPLPKGSIDAAASNTNPNYDCRLYTNACPAGNGGFGIFRKKGVHITSDVDIVAYAHIYGSVSSGATMLLPTNSWGYSYTTINSSQQSACQSNNFFYVIAKTDSTRIKITASQNANVAASCSFTAPPPNVAYYVYLNKGQIYQYTGLTDVNGNGVQLTGSKIEAVPNASGKCFPIAVFAGSGRTSGEAGGSCTQGGRDNDMQQCFPEHTWGREYATVPFSPGGGNPQLQPNVFTGCVYKIVARDDSTRISINGGAAILLRNRVTDRYQFSNSTPNYIKADKPIMVAQFMTSGNCGGGDGDPEMVYLSPLEQAIPKVGFYRNNVEAIDENYMTIVIPDSGVACLKINGQGYTGNATTNWGGNSNLISFPPGSGLTGYKIVVKGWTSAKAQVLVSSCARFNIMTYGLGGAESYGYSGGAYFNNVSGVAVCYNNSALDTSKSQGTIDTTQHTFAYYGNPFKMRVQTLKKVNIINWGFSRMIDTNNATIYRTPRIFNGTNNVFQRNKDTTDYHPKPIDSTLVNGVWTNFVYQCPADTVLIYKKGSFTGHTGGKDTFFIPITTNDNDSATLFQTSLTRCYGLNGALGDTLLLPYQFANGGNVNVVAQVAPCKSGTSSFDGPDSLTNGSIRSKVILWYWQFEDGTTSNLQKPSHVLTKDSNYVTLTTITEDGYTKVANFIYYSFVVKTSVPKRVCLGQTITAIDSTSYLNRDSCTWDFGDGTPVVLDRTCKSVTHKYTQAGTYIIKHTVSFGLACDTLQFKYDTIIVDDKLHPSITFPTDCIAKTGLANLFITPSTMSTVKLDTILWNFGEPSSGAFNTSQVNPTNHIYANEDTFLCTLHIRDSLGCYGDTTAKVVIKISPDIYFNSLASVCVNKTTYSIASFAGCNNQSKTLGSGKFYGPGVDTAGNFNPQSAGAGTHTIWYVYTSKHGCKDSLSQQITVLAKPTVDFDYTKGCLPKNGVAQFTNLTTIQAPANLSTFSWNFDDAANSNTSNPNVVDSMNPSHVFANTGTHNVRLVAVSADGCKDSTSKSIVFSVTPSIVYTALNSVCEDQTSVLVDKASVVNGVLGTGVYSGPGTTSAGVLSPAVSSYGNHTITYIFTSTGNCADTATQTILVKARPRIAFTFPAGCLPSNGIVNFTDNTTIPDGQTVQSCTWNFGHSSTGNPGTSNTCSPSHTYPYGSYTLYHSVTSSLGCTTDTTFNTTFNISPDLYYSTISASPVCQNITSVSVASAGCNNTSAAPGSGVYKGTGIIDSVAGPKGNNTHIQSSVATTVWPETFNPNAINPMMTNHM